MAKIEKGAVLTVADTRSGTGSKGDWCFSKPRAIKSLQYGLKITILSARSVIW